jgi:transposase
MSIRVAPLVISETDRLILESWLRSPTVESGLARRARIVLLAAEQRSNTEIAELVGVSRPTVLAWRGRFQAGGVAALVDLDRPGRPRVVSHNDVVVATLSKPPARLGVTHWSSRLLAKELGISFATVAKVWRDWDLQPWRVATFKFSTDPELDAKVRDVVGLYMNPPHNAIVVCVDEKTQIQALDRPPRSCRYGLGSRRNRPTTTNATARPACSPHWRSRPAKSPTPATTGTPTPSSWLS